MPNVQRFEVTVNCGSPVKVQRYRVAFVWGAATQIIEAKDITQARRIASRRWGKMNVRGIKAVA